MQTLGAGLMLILSLAVFALVVVWIIFPLLALSKMNRIIKLLEPAAESSLRNLTTATKAADELQCRCPDCGIGFSFDAARAGKSGVCPKCGCRVTLPKREEIATAQ